MSTSNKWNEIGEDILNSVIQAVDSGDFTGLSQSVGDMINETAYSISRGIDHVGKEIERQAKMHGANISDAAGVWSAHGAAGRKGGNGGAGGIGRNTAAGGDSRSRGAGVWSAGTNPTAQPQLPARYRKFLPGQAAGPACLAVGIVGTSMFGIATIATAITAVFTGFSIGIPLGLGIATVPFIGLITKGANLNGRNHRFRDYVRVIGNKGYCAIEDLARATGKKKAYVKKDLQDMLRRGYFLEGHMDAGQTTLIVDNETYRQYEEAEEARVKREKEEVRWEKETKDCPDEVQKILAEGQTYIAHIHECNDAIPGAVMSEKLAKLEDIMRRIFAQVKKQPESADDLHKFMTYYLPTTTKLIDAYRDLDGQPEYGTNVANTKKEIEDTLDTINEAFENLFDSLFEDTAWDISSDISTMKVMLQQEGLTKNTDFK
ncbi:MAG: 5-bromo-4-chloroindolyl phosphate hydrolysis family protein [Lachnospiraceae bacterium]|nr:5-bromo-4-chloroindolyl phosphate hydrolysis family protein [Lachnospiraceae bacterium]